MIEYPNPFLKLTFGGTLAQGQDEWNCGINLGISREGLLPINDEVASDTLTSYANLMNNEIEDIISSYISSPVMQIPRYATLDYIKLAAIGKDGKYIDDSKIWEPEDVTGATLGAYVPQISLVMTLQSNKRSDPGKFGRFYLPTAAPTGNGVYRPTGTAQKAELTADLISQLDRTVDRLSFPKRVYPAAVTSSEKFTGDYREFTKVKVGNVFDTQRRRRNRIAEIYEEAIVPEVAPIPEPVTP